MRKAGLAAVAALALALGRGTTCTLAQDFIIDDDEEQVESIPVPELKFAPELEKKFSDLLEKLKIAKRKNWEERMKEEIDEIRKTTGLSVEGAKVLEPRVAEVIEANLKVWIPKVEAMFRTAARQQQGIEQMIEQALPMVEMYAKEDIVPESAHPAQSEPWKEALKAGLSPEQWQAWSAVLTARKKTAEDEVLKHMMPMLDRAREQYGSGIRGKAAEMGRTLGLPRERLDALQALAKEATEKSLEKWKERAERFVMSAKPEQRKMMAQGRMYLGTNEEELPERGKFWSAGLAKVLTPEELQRWEGSKEEHKTRRTKVLARILLLTLDQKVAFTKEQREKLQPLAEKLVLAEPTLYPASMQMYENFPLTTFLTAAAKAPEKELRSVLDESQWKHWQAASKSDPRAVRPQRDLRPVAKGPEPEPEEVEKSISEFLFEKATTERAKVVADLSLKAEDAARVAGLSPEARVHLETAARGSAEEVLNPWRAELAQRVRGNMTDATGRNVQQVLLGMEDYNFRRNDDGSNAKQTLWKKAVARELTEPQLAAWKAEEDARTEYKQKAVLSAVLAEFDRRVSLSPEQTEKLEPLLAKMVKEYGAEISSYFSFGDNGPWFLQSYTKFLPLAGVPEAELKAVLDKDQWEAWTSSNEYATTQNYWSNIQQMHNNRRQAAER